MVRTALIKAALNLRNAHNIVEYAVGRLVNCLFALIISHFVMCLLSLCVVCTDSTKCYQL